VLQGYGLDPTIVGFGCPPRWGQVIDTTPEIIEAHHTTGDDCFVFKVVARTMRDLERITGRLATLGSITTSVVYSSTLPGRPIAPAR